jgi:hypothetical protein
MAVEAVMEALAGVSALPPLQLAVLGALAFVALAFAGRLVQRNLPGKSPPILEGVPFIGGLLKFAGVRAAARRAAPGAAACAQAALPATSRGPGGPSRAAPLSPAAAARPRRPRPRGRDRAAGSPPPGPEPPPAPRQLAPPLDRRPYVSPSCLASPDPSPSFHPTPTPTQRAPGS